MSPPGSPTTTPRNKLLAALPPEEYALLAPHLERVPLEFGRVICDVLVPIPYVYFPETGIISQLSVMADRSAVETATIGHEGMAGIEIFHGVDCTPEHAFVQVPGEGFRIPSDVFRDLVKRAPRLTELLHRYSVALLTLVGQNSGCNRKHSMVQRCARWMLMSHDRAGRDQFELTHHILSQMLGVRRASVSLAAEALHRAGVIDYKRGRVTIRDRAGLERHACECYGIIRSTFDRLFGGSGAISDPLAGLRLSDHGKSIAKDGAPDPENEPSGAELSATRGAPHDE